MEKHINMKFEPLTKKQMSMIAGGRAQETCTGGGSRIIFANTPYESTYNYSSDCVNQGGVEGSSSWYPAGDAQDGC